MVAAGTQFQHGPYFENRAPMYRFSLYSRPFKHNITRCVSSVRIDRTHSPIARPGLAGCGGRPAPLLRARLHLVLVVGGAERVNALTRLKPRRGLSAPPQRRGKQRRLGVERCRMSNLGRLQHTWCRRRGLDG